MRVLAFDFGASSGRAMLASFDGKRIAMEEIHRFPNDPVRMNGTLYWDVPRLFFEIKEGLRKARKAGGFDAIGIDTWGCDFALLDEYGDLIANPVHYRDERTVGVFEKAFQILPKEELYRRTGTQFLRFNTLFQLYCLKEKRPDLLSRTKDFLMIPDYFHFLLTGEKAVEFTNASTTQMLNPQTGDWDEELIKTFGIPTEILPKVIPAGSRIGTLSPQIQEELGLPPIPVIAVATHDTAAAIAATPAQSEDFIYVSCGTWSLFGTELPTPLINEATARFNLTNEGGFQNTTTLLKNIMGLWLIQESRRQWIREGFEVSYADLEREALAEKPFACFIDPDAVEFETPGNLPKRIQDFCARTGQYVPQRRGEIMRCIYESLALKYRQVFDMTKAVTGKDYPVIHIIGGGTKDRFLCQLAANACNIPVKAGPIEATVMGNIVIQLISMGAVASLGEARRIVADSAETFSYQPNREEDWEDAYRRFLAVVGQ